MKKTIRSAVVAAMIGSAALGLAGIAPAAPLNDPSSLCSFHDADGNCAFAASGPSRNADLVFPASGPQEQQIVDYLTSVLQEFDTEAGPLGTLEDPKPMQELEATSSTYTSSNTQTVVVKVYQNLGGAHPATWYRSFSYDNAAKAPLTFATLFRPGTRPLDVIAPIVAQQMSADAGQPISIDPAVGSDPANYQNFALTDDAVVFFFDRDQMHPAYGATEVSVPRSAVAQFLIPGL